MNNIELLREYGIADNDFRASAIATGLRLWECSSDEERIERARLYRDWRNSQIYGKQTAPCFEKAIAGEAVPVAELFQPCGHPMMDIVESNDGTCYCGACADAARFETYKDGSAI